MLGLSRRASSLLAASDIASIALRQRDEERRGRPLLLLYGRIRRPVFAHREDRRGSWSPDRAGRGGGRAGRHAREIADGLAREGAAPGEGLRITYGRSAEHASKNTHQKRNREA